MYRFKYVKGQPVVYILKVWDDGDNDYIEERVYTGYNEKEVLSRVRLDFTKWVDELSEDDDEVDITIALNDKLYQNHGTYNYVKFYKAYTYHSDKRFIPSTA